MAGICDSRNRAHMALIGYFFPLCIAHSSSLLTYLCSGYLLKAKLLPNSSQANSSNSTSEGILSGHVIDFVVTYCAHCLLWWSTGHWWSVGSHRLQGWAINHVSCSPCNTQVCMNNIVTLPMYLAVNIQKPSDLDPSTNSMMRIEIDWESVSWVLVLRCWGILVQLFSC